MPALADVPTRVTAEAGRTTIDIEWARAEFLQLRLREAGIQAVAQYDTVARTARLDVGGRSPEEVEAALDDMGLLTA